MSTEKTATETVDQLKELRKIEHEQMILEYIEQVPILRIPAMTHRLFVAALMEEYNEKYFPEKTEGDDKTGDKKKPGKEDKKSGE